MVERGFSPRRRTIGSVAVWVLQIALALAYGTAAIANLAGDPKIVGLFDRIGFGEPFRYFTAVTEIAGALILLSRRYAVYGAIWLTLMMVVGVLLHIFLLGDDPAPPILFGILTGLMVWCRRRQLGRLGSARAAAAGT